MHQLLGLSHGVTRPSRLNLGGTLTFCILMASQLLLAAAESCSIDDGHMATLSGAATSASLTGSKRRGDSTTYSSASLIKRRPLEFHEAGEGDCCLEPAVTSRSTVTARQGAGKPTPLTALAARRAGLAHASGAPSLDVLPSTASSGFASSASAGAASSMMTPPAASGHAKAEPVMLGPAAATMAEDTSAAPLLRSRQLQRKLAAVPRRLAVAGGIVPGRPDRMLVDVTASDDGELISDPPLAHVLLAPFVRSSSGEVTSVIRDAGSGATREWCCTLCGRCAVSDRKARAHALVVHLLAAPAPTARVPSGASRAAAPASSVRATREKQRQPSSSSSGSLPLKSSASGPPPFFEPYAPFTQRWAAGYGPAGVAGGRGNGDGRWLCSLCPAAAAAGAAPFKPVLFSQASAWEHACTHIHSMLDPWLRVCIEGSRQADATALLSSHTALARLAAQLSSSCATAGDFAADARHAGEGAAIAAAAISLDGAAASAGTSAAGAGFSSNGSSSSGSSSMPTSHGTGSMSSLSSSASSSAPAPIQSVHRRPGASHPSRPGWVLTLLGRATYAMPAPTPFHLKYAPTVDRASGGCSPSPAAAGSALAREWCCLICGSCSVGDAAAQAHLEESHAFRAAVRCALTTCAVGASPSAAAAAGSAACTGAASAASSSAGIPTPSLVGADDVLVSYGAAHPTRPGWHLADCGAGGVPCRLPGLATLRPLLHMLYSPLYAWQPAGLLPLHEPPADGRAWVRPKLAGGAADREWRCKVCGQLSKGDAAALLHTAQQHEAVALSADAAAEVQAAADAAAAAQLSAAQARATKEARALDAPAAAKPLVNIRQLPTAGGHERTLLDPRTGPLRLLIPRPPFDHMLMLQRGAVPIITAASVSSATVPVAADDSAAAGSDAASCDTKAAIVAAMKADSAAAAAIIAAASASSTAAAAARAIASSVGSAAEREWCCTLCSRCSIGDAAAHAHAATRHGLGLRDAPLPQLRQRASRAVSAGSGAAAGPAATPAPSHSFATRTRVRDAAAALRVPSSSDLTAKAMDAGSAAAGGPATVMAAAAGNRELAEGHHQLAEDSDDQDDDDDGDNDDGDDDDDVQDADDCEDDDRDGDDGDGDDIDGWFRGDAAAEQEGVEVASRAASGGASNSGSAAAVPKRVWPRSTKTSAFQDVETVLPLHLVVPGGSVPSRPGCILVDPAVSDGHGLLRKHPAPQQHLLFSPFHRLADGRCIPLLEAAGASDRREWCCQLCGLCSLSDAAAKRHAATAHGLTATRPAQPAAASAASEAAKVAATQAVAVAAAVAAAVRPGLVDPCDPTRMLLDKEGYSRPGHGITWPPPGQLLSVPFVRAVDGSMTPQLNRKGDARRRLWVCTNCGMRRKGDLVRVPHAPDCRFNLKARWRDGSGGVEPQSQADGSEAAMQASDLPAEGSASGPAVFAALSAEAAALGLAIPAALSAALSTEAAALGLEQHAALPADDTALAHVVPATLPAAGAAVGLPLPATLPAEPRAAIVARAACTHASLNYERLHERELQGAGAIVLSSRHARADEGGAIATGSAAATSTADAAQRERFSLLTSIPAEYLDETC